MPRSSSLVPCSWYLRVQHLLGTTLRERLLADWKTIYPLLLATKENEGVKLNIAILRYPLAVEVLIEAGEDPSAENNYAIRTAAEEGYTEAVKILLADPRVDPTVDYDNGSPLNLALENQHLEVVKLLIVDSRVDPTVDNNRAINFSAENGYTEVVQLLLADPRVDPTTNNNQAIRAASRNGYTEVVKLLLTDPRVNPADLDDRAILEASKHRRTEVVRLLIADPRVDPSSGGDNYAIRIAAIRGYADVVEILLTDPRVDPTTEDNAAIKQAVGYEYVEVIKVLLTDPRVDPTSAVKIATDNLRLEALNLLASDLRVDVQSLDEATLKDLLIMVEYRDKLLTQNFERDHYYIFLREVLVKRRDLKYYFQWLVDQCARHENALEYRRVIAAAAESLLTTGKVVHTSPYFTAYSGFLLLAKTDNLQAIFNLLSSEEGVTEEGIQLARTLLEAYLDLSYSEK